jgi:hypothetical protein
MLQFDVPELVERTSLAENTAPVRVVKECHQPERQTATERQPATGYQPLRPGQAELATARPTVTATPVPAAIDRPSSSAITCPVSGVVGRVPAGDGDAGQDGGGSGYQREQ